MTVPPLFLLLLVLSVSLFLLSSPAEAEISDLQGQVRITYRKLYANQTEIARIQGLTDNLRESVSENT